MRHTLLAPGDFSGPPPGGKTVPERCCRRVTQPTFIAGPLGVMPENPAHMIISRSFLVNLQYETQASIY